MLNDTSYLVKIVELKIMINLTLSMLINSIIKDNENSLWEVKHEKYLFGVIMKKALITGITGQDGSYLAEFLL